MLKPPSELLETWIERIPLGYALDLGAGEGEATVWLAERGFKVEAVDRDPEACDHLRQITRRLEVEIHPKDVCEFEFPYGKYHFVLASAVLHFLRPTNLWPLADRVVAALAPGGYLIAEVLTTDDPGYDALKNSGSRQVEPNTFFMSSDEGVLHYFVPDELRRVFSALEVAHYEESRRIDSEDPIGFRSGASLVARKKIR
jgi:SAM-dependent methyltransferase